MAVRVINEHVSCIAVLSTTAVTGYHGESRNSMR